MQCSLMHTCRCVCHAQRHARLTHIAITVSDRLTQTSRKAHTMSSAKQQRRTALPLLCTTALQVVQSRKCRGAHVHAKCHPCATAAQNTAPALAAADLADCAGRAAPPVVAAAAAAAAARQPMPLLPPALRIPCLLLLP